jgi:threonine synthase
MPSDGGLYMPEFIPVLNDTEIHRMEVESIPEIAMTVLKDYVSEDINITELEEIVWEALNFQFPVKAIDENKAVLELFHGPTLAFKDVGARFMSRLMSKLIRNEKQGQNIIVATSGDTGSAVASGFYNVEGVQVFILFPAGKISTLQQKQMTTLGKNIKPIEVKGTFDDCQKIVKKALNDEYINEKHQVTTANSINVARLLPQAVYYFKRKKKSFSVSQAVISEIFAQGSWLRKWDFISLIFLPQPM